MAEERVTDEQGPWMWREDLLAVMSSLWLHWMEHRTYVDPLLWPLMEDTADGRLRNWLTLCHREDEIQRCCSLLWLLPRCIRPCSPHVTSKEPDQEQGRR